MEIKESICEILIMYIAKNSCISHKKPIDRKTTE